MKSSLVLFIMAVSIIGETFWTEAKSLNRISEKGATAQEDGKGLLRNPMIEEKQEGMPVSKGPLVWNENSREVKYPKHLENFLKRYRRDENSDYEGYDPYK